VTAQIPGYQLIDHPADLGIEAFGKDLLEAFEQAALGLMSVILQIDLVEAREDRSVTLQASDLDHLLVKWLTEILYLYDGAGFAACQFEIDVLTPASLSAKVLGEPFAADRHVTRLDVKAVTYHQLSVEKHESGARVQVFLDI
jgi:SHS2 domain-containing protein